MAYVNGYGYGGTPYWQFIDANGNPLSNGKVATYIAGTTTAYNTLKDWNHTYNGVVFDLDIRGGCSMIWPTTQLIKIIVKDVDGNLFKTLDNIQASGSEGGYIPGTTVIRVDGTDNEIISTASADPEDPTKLIFTISLDPAITEAIATNASDIVGIQTHINNIDNSITTINDTLDTIQRDVDIVESDVDIVEGDVAALKLSDQYTTFKATSAAGSGGYTFKIATALKTKAPLTSTTILEYDLTNNYLGKINAAWGMRGHVVYQQIMQMDDQYTAVDYMHYTHLYEFPDRWELWGHTAAGWAGDISIRPSKNISIAITVHVNPWVFVGKAVIASLPTVYTEHNWVDYTQPVNDSKKTSVWAGGEGTSDHKVMIDANDQNAKYLNDKILTGGILTKAIEAAGEVGDWYEVLRLTATLYTDGITCSGAGTSDDPLVATGDHKAMCSTGDIPGYLENKLVGSDWLNVTEIPLSANEKNIKFALNNPDFFIKGNTIYGGQVVGVIGDLDEQSHNGYYTCYHSTLHAPPAQPGNPSWFIHHMNSNTANYYAVQIAYAYTSTIICYERTKVAGVWQPWILRSNTGVGTGEVKVTSAGVAGYLANKLTVAPGSPLTATVSGDTLVLDFLENNVADPLIRTLDLLAENGTCVLTGSCWSSEGSIEGGNWGGLEQNTTDSFYKIVPLSRGTVTKAAVYIAQVNGTDSYYGSGNYGAIRLGLFAADGTLKGQTAWTRGISAIGRLTLDLTAAEGQNLTIERNTQYWVGIIGRGLSILSNNKSSSSINLSSLRYSVQIRTSSSGASWETFATDGSGYVQKNIMIAQMSATEESA